MDGFVCQHYGLNASGTSIQPFLIGKESIGSDKMEEKSKNRNGEIGLVYSVIKRSARNDTG